MNFEPGRRYVGHADDFSIDMIPKEISKRYPKKGEVSVFVWRVRITEHGVTRKFGIPVGEKGATDLMKKYGRSPDELKWESGDDTSGLDDAWINDINYKDRFNCIYFILADGANRVKIGWASDLVARFSFFMTSSPFPLVILCTVAGKQEDERMYHKKFAHLRVHNEWFIYSDELKEFIENLKNSSVKCQKPIDNSVKQC